MSNKHPYSLYFDHLRIDFEVRGIIIFNANAGMARVNFVGYPYCPYRAVNDNGVLG